MIKIKVEFDDKNGKESIEKSFEGGVDTSWIELLSNFRDVLKGLNYVPTEDLDEYISLKEKQSLSHNLTIKDEGILYTI